MYTNNFKMILASLAGAALMLVSCEERYVFEIAEDPGYVTDPVVAIRALDGDAWIDGVIDQDAKTITFEFHTSASLEKIVLDVELNKNWAEMVSPTQTRFTANVKNDYKFTVNNGYDDVNYTVKSSMFRHIKEVKAKLGSDEVKLSAADNTFSGSFPSVFLASEVKNVDLDVVPNEGVELVTDPEKLKGLDFSNGEGVEVTVLDKIVGRKKTFMVYANPSDLANLDSSWGEVTRSWASQYGIKFGNIRMYKTESLNGAPGNVGYLFTVPAGLVDMKVAEKYNCELTNSTERKISGTVRKIRDYTMFITYFGAGDIYRPDGVNQVYLSPLAYGPDNKGVTKVLRPDDGWNKQTKAYAPAIGVKDGKIQIKPAITKNDKIYCYSDVKGTGEQEWDVDAAMGGMFHLVKDGVALISSDSEKALNDYAQTWLATPDLTTRLVNGQAWIPLAQYAKYRNGRTLLGCTAKGDLIILTVEKVVDWDNSGRLEDAGHNGLNGDVRGVNFYDASQIMLNLGCSDAMAVEDICWAPVILQDGGDRGKDVFKTYRRFDLRGDGHFRAESDNFEFENLVTLCIK